MALMFIDTRTPPPASPSSESRRRDVRPLARVCAGLFLIGVAGTVPPVLSYLFVLGGGGLAVRTLAKLIPSSNGLEDHRQ